MNEGPFEWINTVADFIVYLLKEVFSVTVSVFTFVFHFANKIFWYLLAEYPTGSKVVLAMLAILGVVLISYPRATIDLLGYIFLGRFIRDHTSKKVPFSAGLLVEPVPEESLMRRDQTSYAIAPMETEEFLVSTEDLDFVRSEMGEEFAKLKVEAQKRKFYESALKWKEFATTRKATLDFFHDLSYFPSAQELYFFEKHGFPLRDRWNNNVGVYTKNVPHVSREKFYLAAQRIKILDRQNEFLRACHDVCIKGRKNAFGIWEGDSSFHYDIRNLASRYGLLLDQSKIATESVKVEETPFIPHGIPRERRFEHTLILADTGWGKTWLMKKLAWHYAKERDSVIIVDSEGSEKGGFVKDALSWRKDADVIYIDFTDPENVPCLSMFDVKLSDEPRERERIMNGTMDLYRYVFTSLLGAGKTANQMTLLENIAQLMLHIPEANISTIKSVLFDINPYRGNVRKLGEHARDFFERDFPTKEWKEVARQVMNRINSVLSNPVLARVLTQSKSKIDLFKAINTGKMIVVNVNRSHLGDAAGLLGRFFIAIQCQAALRREEDVQYRPAFLFVDEAWRYFDEKIEEMLNTIRKRRLGLVIGTQQISQFKNVSMSLRTAAFQSAIKFAGMMTDAENTEVIKELGLDPKSSSTRTLIQKKEGEKLFASEFFVHIKGQQAKKVNIDFTDVQNAPRLSKTEIKELFEDNNRLYCEKVRVRGERAEAATGETVYEPDEQGVLRPRGLPQPDRSDDFWQ